MNALPFTAAMVVVATALPSRAADWDLRVSGHYDAFVAYATADVDNAPAVDFDGVDVSSNAEIFFRPSLTLDNGVRIEAHVQLEGESSGDQIDESFVIIDGSFGRILLGSENSAGFLLHVEAPNALIHGPEEIPDFLPIDGFVGVNVGDDFTRGTLGETSIENDRNNDAKRFTYISPRFYDFKLGFSYAHDAIQDGFGPTDRNAVAVADIFDVALQYEGMIGPVKLAASARWGIAQNVPGNLKPIVWGAGINIGYGGFTVGGSFAEQNQSGTEDGTIFDVGIAYEIDAWTFSATWVSGENVDDEQPFLGADEEADLILAGVAYELTKGLTLNAFGAYARFTENQGDAGGPGNDADGFVLGTAIRLRF